jgi:hypothetical protein
MTPQQMIDRVVSFEKEAARRLSQAEEIIGRAYSKIADHYVQVSDTYRMISSKFASLAEDERSHCDITSCGKMQRLASVRRRFDRLDLDR